MRIKSNVPRRAGVERHRYNMPRCKTITKFVSPKWSNGDTVTNEIVRGVRIESRKRVAQKLGCKEDEDEILRKEGRGKEERKKKKNCIV